MMSSDEEQKECVCVSVLLFACKGVIEGIIVLLFLWLLVQVLFTKQLEGMTKKTIYSINAVLKMY